MSRPRDLRADWIIMKSFGRNLQGSDLRANENMRARHATFHVSGQMRTSQALFTGSIELHERAEMCDFFWPSAASFRRSFTDGLPAVQLCILSQLRHSIDLSSAHRARPFYVKFSVLVIFYFFFFFSILLWQLIDFYFFIRIKMLINVALKSFDQTWRWFQLVFDMAKKLVASWRAAKDAKRK